MKKFFWVNIQCYWANRPISPIFLLKSPFFLMFMGCIGPSRGPRVWDHCSIVIWKIYSPINITSQGHILNISTVEIRSKIDWCAVVKVPVLPWTTKHDRWSKLVKVFAVSLCQNCQICIIRRWQLRTINSSVNTIWNVDLFAWAIRLRIKAGFIWCLIISKPKTKNMNSHQN